ncbi:hypothetical protein ACIBF1_00600 [Spirillospora sp. NPDC050679]
MTERRDFETPVLLRVYPPAAPVVGDSICVVRDMAGWGYQSSTGKWLGLCSEPDVAADMVTGQFACFGLWPSWDGRRPC